MNVFNNLFGCPKGEQPSDLQSLCLSVIVEFFDGYCRTFKESNSIALGKSLEFLARRFSETIFCRLKQNRKLKTEHLDLLISRHTKKLNIEGIEEELLPHLIARLETHGNNVLNFEARSADLPEYLRMCLIKTLPNVQNIEFTGGLTYNLRHFYDVRKTNLEVRIPQICEAIGKHCTSLKNLTFKFYYAPSFEKYYNDGIAFILNHCQYLETLENGDTVGALYTLHKSELTSIRNNKSAIFQTEAKYVLKNLSSYCRNYPLLDALEVCAAMCPYVSSLNLRLVESDEELEVISHFTNLQHVTLRQMTSITQGGLTKFLNFRGSQLTNLSVVCVPGLCAKALITSCPKLQSLKLWKVQNLTVSDVGELCPKVSLRYLLTLKLVSSKFGTPDADNSARLIISAAKNLKTLSLSLSSGLTCEFVRSLNLLGIYTLDASFSDISAHTLIEVLSEGNLQELNVKFCSELIDNDFVELTRCASGVQRNVTIEWHDFRELLLQQRR